MEMIVLMPIGGKSSRFLKEGYKISKTMLPITDRFTGKKILMTLAAMKDIPWLSQKNTKLIIVGSPDQEKNNLKKKIQTKYNNSIFIPDYVMLDQAYGCFLARSLLDSNEELFIGACDNGFDIDLKKFNKMKKNFDAIMLSHTQDTNIVNNPNAHSWARVSKNNSVTEVSLKKIISNDFYFDHATTGMFWFKRASDFLKYLTQMIWANDTLDNKFYLDNVLNYYIKDRKKVGYFDVRYICWGTPFDYEGYENTIQYWKKFQKIK